MRSNLLYLATSLCVACLVVAVYFLGSAAGAFFFSRTSVEKPLNPVARVARSFNTTTDTAQRVEMVRELKTYYMSTTTPSVRAKILNMLGGMAHSAHEPEIFDAIFEGEPFADLLKEDGARDSLENLAMLSYETYPTAYGIQYAVFEDALRIRYLAKQENGQQYEEELNTLIERVLRHIEMAEAAISRDVLEAESPTEAINTLVSYYRIQGHLYGDIAYARPEYLDIALAHISKALEIGESFRNVHGELYPSIKLKLASLHWGYARYTMNSPGGMERHPEFKEHIADFIDMLKHSKSEMGSFYIRFENVRARLAEEHDNHRVDPQHADLLELQDAQVRDIASLSPEAEEFFRDIGIEF